MPHGIAVLCGLYIALNLNTPNSISSICNYQADLIKELLEMAIHDEKLNIEIQISKLKNLLDADKKNACPGQVRLILPTFVTKSLWISEDITPHYGLNYFDMNLNECLDSFNCLNQIKGIYFY